MSVEPIKQAQQLDEPTSREVAEVRKRMQMARILDEVLEDLRLVQRTSDYLTGYSLNEVITERVRVIGSQTKKEERVGNQLTLIAKLVSLKKEGTDAIDAALNIIEQIPAGEKSEDVKGQP